MEDSVKYLLAKLIRVKHRKEEPAKPQQKDNVYLTDVEKRLKDVKRLPEVK